MKPYSNHPRGRLTVVIGGQYGSEAKGKVVSYLAPEVDVAVRTGAPNAGHTVIHNHQTYKLQQIPATVFNKKSTLCIGAGGLIDPIILERECQQTRCKSRLIIDPQAGIIEPRHAEQEGELKARISSTGKGCGAALIDRIWRRDFLLARDALKNYHIQPVAPFINRAIDAGRHVLVEGTQGFGLSLYHGQYPFVTSRDTTAAAFLSECGLSPRLVTDIILVIRTFPIRVGGPSGPLKHETTWAAISKRVGRPIVETTTVTQKIRRVGKFDLGQVKRAVMINRPTQIALQFLNYAYPLDENCTTWNQLSRSARSYIKQLENDLGVPITLIGTGEQPKAMIDRR